MIKSLSASLLRMCVVVLALCLLPLIARADNGTATPQAKLVEGLGQQALDLLANVKVTHEERQSQFEKMLKDNFDVDRIGRFVLGRYWRTATPEQQKAYQDLFERWIVIVYTDRLENYSGETFTVVGSHTNNAGTFVDSLIKPQQGPPIHVGWEVAGTDQSPKIIDVIVEGISMLVSQRDEFGAIISDNNGSIDALIAKLKERISQP